MLPFDSQYTYNLDGAGLIGHFPILYYPYAGTAMNCLLQLGAELISPQKLTGYLNFYINQPTRCRFYASLFKPSLKALNALIGLLQGLFSGS